MKWGKFCFRVRFRFRIRADLSSSGLNYWAPVSSSFEQDAFKFLTEARNELVFNIRRGEVEVTTHDRV